MAEGPGNTGSSRETQYLSTQEEQYISELEDEDPEEQLAIEKELAAQRLWLAFQESAGAVSQLLRGQCQHNYRKYGRIVLGSSELGYFISPVLTNRLAFEISFG